MAHFTVLSIFPAVFEAYLAQGVIGRARERGLVRVDLMDIRDYTEDRHRTVDDTPYGGGPGMVMKAEPLARAVDDVLSDGLPTRTVMMSPQGRPFTQAMAEEFSREERRVLIVSGRYEGVDQRFVDGYVDEEISIGDYILTGGELPALVIMDAALRLVPGVVGDSGSLDAESFTWGLLDYAHYTRPPEWRGMGVPGELTSGNHAQIERFRRKDALRRTHERRPDLLEGAALGEKDIKLLREIQEEEDGFR